MLIGMPLQIGIPGGPELVVILLIAMLLFGPDKIPEVARSAGKAMGEFQKGRQRGMQTHGQGHKEASSEQPQEENHPPEQDQESQ